MLEFRDGRREAFDDLVRRNHGKVYSLLYRFLGNAAECDDLAQEVFMRVLRSADRYVPTAKFNTWLYRIAANAALNQIRSRSRGRPVSLEIDAGGTGDEFKREISDPRLGEPNDRMDRGELADQVATAVAQLPEKQRIAIVLNKYEGLCYEDIAQVLDCTTMAVKSLLSRARGNLRDRLARYVDGGHAVDPPDEPG
jgi:RNA polymerase sigma-70 factor (ECF subfamily)